MAYATYTTEAIVCGSTHHNTSDKSFLLFTKDAGMVYASARSVREERSKQRGALQEFSIVRVSLIRGKSGWRIGSVESEASPYSGTASREARGALVRMVKLVRQYVRGEEPHPALYKDLACGLVAAAGSDADAAPRIADAFALRLLHKLGYIAEADAYRALLEDDRWTSEHEPLPKAAHDAVSRALRASHL